MIVLQYAYGIDFGSEIDNDCNNLIMFIQFKLIIYKKICYIRKYIRFDKVDNVLLIHRYISVSKNLNE